MILRAVAVCALLMTASPVLATTYYISPSGSDANNGLSQGAPFLTFAFAINPARAWCGHELVLLNGTYGDTSSTGKLHVTNVTCTAASRLVVRALNQRQAHVFDNGNFIAVYVNNSDYITIDGIYAYSQDVPVTNTALKGLPFRVQDSSNIIMRNLLAYNPNRYGNSNVFTTQSSSNVLWEDNEGYKFHRHCNTAGGTTGKTEFITWRRIYCNPRGGKIAGGFSAGGAPLGSGDSIASMYPCQNCILENSIADSTTHSMFINEQNARFDSGTAVDGNKVLGNISYNSNYANQIIPNPRGSGANYAPRNGLIRDNVEVRHRGASPFILCSDCTNYTIDHNTAFGETLANPNLNSSGVHIDNPAIRAIDSTGTYPGVAGSLLSVVITNNLVTGFWTFAYQVTGVGTWSGDKLYSYNNGSNFSPSLPSNWGTTSTADPQMGTCKFWVPAGSPLKGAATDGGDIGATILYRYVDGVLTTTPLWDPVTGEFPHGEKVAGINDVAGESLFDFHQRSGLNVNSGGCSFPAGYGGAGGGGGGGGGSPSTVVQGTSGTFTATAQALTVTAGTDFFGVCIALNDSGGNVGSVTSMDLSGEALTLVKAQSTTPAYRRVELWGKLNPTSGSRTLNLTTTGTVPGYVGRWQNYDITGGIHTSGSVASPANTPTNTSSVTVTTGPNELVIDCLASNKSFTSTVGANQTSNTPADHPSLALRLNTSYQNGSDGGVADWSFGGSAYITHVAASLDATPSDPPSTATLTQSKYRFYSTYGPLNSKAPIGNESQATEIGPNGEFGMLVEVTAGVATTPAFGVSLWCNKNSTTYSQVTNVFGAHGLRLYGPGFLPDLPSHGSVPSQRFTPSGSYTPGWVIRDASATLFIPAMAAGNKTELEFVGGSSLSPGDSVACEVRTDNGTALDAYTVRPTLLGIGARGAFSN